jgi:hypothetical protein
MNPQAPKLKAKIKIHKPSALAKHIYQKFKDFINLKYEYIINTAQFAENISKLS